MEGYIFNSLSGAEVSRADHTSHNINCTYCDKALSLIRESYTSLWYNMFRSYYCIDKLPERMDTEVHQSEFLGRTLVMTVFSAKWYQHITSRSAGTNMVHLMSQVNQSIQPNPKHVVRMHRLGKADIPNFIVLVRFQNVEDKYWVMG